MAAPRKAKASNTLIYVAALVGAAAIAAALVYFRKTPPASTRLEGKAGAPSSLRASDASVFKEYGGSESCKSCHETEYRLWRDSHHGLAEQRMDNSLDASAFSKQPQIIHGSQTSEALATNGTFELITTALDGKPRAFVPERVIGVDPLRQFIIPANGGRFQVTELAFDPIHSNWFDVYGQEDRKAGEWGHWTGRGMTWNSMCAACHNTRLRKHYVEATDTYNTTMAEMSVGCEACHGPLAAHNAWQKAHASRSSSSPPREERRPTEADPTIKHLSRDQTLHTCASCHSRRAELTGEFVPGDNFYDHYALSIPDETDLFYPDGQIRDEDYEFTAFLGSRMHAAGVRCMDCHEPHSAKVRVPGNALCMTCHASGQSVSPAPTQANAKIGAAPVIDPTTHSHHKIEGAGDSCVACHMPVTHYMQRHGRHDHGFTIPEPLLTKEAGIPNACDRCHAKEGVDWAVAAVEKWYGKRMERPSRSHARIMVRAKGGDAKSPTELVQLAGIETNSFWRAVSAGFLRRWNSDTNIARALATLANDPDPLVRAMSLRSLESTGEQALRPHLNDPVRCVRIDAAWGLRQSQSLDTNSPAVLDLLNYLRHSGDQPSGAMQTGVFELDRDNVQAAIQYLRKAVAWDTNSAPPRHALAVALSLAGERAEAVEQLQTACRLAPRDAELRFKLGLALNEAGQPNAARAALEEAVKLDPQFAQAWYNLGLARNSAGETDGALDALLRAEALDEHAPQIPYARATILARLGRNEEALKAARRALELRPDYQDAANLIKSLEQ
jgi:tetratricopeptide (TPR) repeat protein